MPSVIICVISLAGQGDIGVPELQEPGPLCDCIRPGLRTPLSVVCTRTQPLDSCIMIARMKRASTPDWDAMLEMADLISLISVGESFWKPN